MPEPESRKATSEPMDQASEPSATRTSGAAEDEYLRGYENGYAAAYNDAIRTLRSAGFDAQAEVVREELWWALWKAKVATTPSCKAGDDRG